jgi:hypothetical protein
MASYLTVAVKCDPASGTAAIEIPKIKLDGSILHVVWWCSNLPKGGTLDVLFEGSKDGPFQRLQRDGNFMIGSGNVGPVAKHDEYPYTVRVWSPGNDCTGDGVVINRAEQALSAGPIHCAPPDGPPICEV